MDKFVIQKYPRFNDELELGDIAVIEMILEDRYHESCDEEHGYEEEILNFYEPYYTHYKTEKYWYNPIDNCEIDSSYDMRAIRETLFLNSIPGGMIRWIENRTDGDIYNYCILTKELLEELLELCRRIGVDENVADEIFPSENDNYDSSYFEEIFKLKTILPHIICETDFDKYEVVCNIL